MTALIARHTPEVRLAGKRGVERGTGGGRNYCHRNAVTLSLFSGLIGCGLTVHLWRWLVIRIVSLSQRHWRRGWWCMERANDHWPQKRWPRLVDVVGTSASMIASVTNWVHIPVKHINTVFQALIVSRLLYALASWGCMLFDSWICWQYWCFLEESTSLWLSS